VRRLALVVIPLALAALTACSGSSTTSGSTGGTAATVKTADQVTADITGKIPSAKLFKTYTAADDPNHQLGRPGGYTSKTAFSDSRVPADEAEFTEPDAVERGGSIEVFADEAGAKTRMDYIQEIVKKLPAATEYEYLNGPVLVRVSKLLTPDQAKEYDAAIR
jgi:hypothetical protein